MSENLNYLFLEFNYNYNYSFLLWIAGLGLLTALIFYLGIIKRPVDDPVISKIAAKIKQGAMVFMRREYSMMAVFLAVVGLLLAVYLGINTAFSFLVGATASGLAGFIGMYSATDANSRTAMQAKIERADVALRIAFSSGAVMGLCVASLGLLGLGLLYLMFGGTPESSHAIHGFGMGASTVAFFARVGGGIYTKSADISADLVGKLELKLPEDDPRNPAVIADNVGDNVGDVAGMGSDIFESYCGSIIATIAIASTLPVWSILTLGNQSLLMGLPLILAGSGLLCSILGLMTVTLLTRFRFSPNLTLRIGTIFATVLFMVAAYFVILNLHLNLKIWYAILFGAIGGIGIGLITEYYTNGSPVKLIAKSAEAGAATVIINGLAIGMESVMVPIILIALIIFGSTSLAGLYGVGIAAVGMLSTVAMTMAIDAYGPVADNAGGLVEMANCGLKARRITDSLDSVGNTTAAIGKGFAVGAAALSALAIITALVETIKIHKPDFVLHLNNPKVLIGMLLGAMLPFLISSILIRAVGNTAFKIINEIRRQFKEFPAILSGKQDPDSNQCIDLAAQNALTQMLFPGLIVIFAPVVIGFGLGPEALGGLLGGALLSCVCLALTMANAGGAWDNAKKWIEQGNLGGRGSLSHKASIIGDTVGDPLKDTSGPSMNILINVMAIVSLVIAPLV